MSKGKKILWRDGIFYNLLNKTTKLVFTGQASLVLDDVFFFKGILGTC